jgi:hypothetical protein
LRAAWAEGIVSTGIEGTQLTVSLASGRLLRSAELVGAVLNWFRIQRTFGSYGQDVGSLGREKASGK